MNPLKVFLILFFFTLSINTLKAEDKISYIDIDYILTNTIIGKSLLSSLKKKSLNPLKPCA